MAQAPGTQDVEKRMMELKSEVLAYQGQLGVTRRLGSDHEVSVLVEECRKKYEEMSRLADQQRRETLDWIQEKLDALES